MSVRRLLSFAVLAIAVCIPSLASAQRAGAPLEAGARIAIVGDSITEQKLYSKYMEAYLLACSGIPELKTCQYGWGGETASGFANRLENDLAGFKPTVVTLCYGMNDGSYQPYNDNIGKSYETNMRNVLKKLEAFGVKTVVVGSPGAVDTYFFRSGQMMGDRPAHVAYNENLGKLRDIDRTLATEFKHRFADVHEAMKSSMEKAQTELGKEYDVCGRDGFHPGPNGQLLMAYAFLKGIGLDGNIGEITINLQGITHGSSGHKISGTSSGEYSVESTRWPFCFQGDAKSSNGTRSIVAHSSFNADLNRFTLKVIGLEKANAEVTWGTETKKFSREKLASGINLAAEFENTPFNAPFDQLLNEIGQKQAFETFMIKQVITTFRSLPQDFRADPEVAGAYATLQKKLVEKHGQFDAAVRKQLVPVKHTIAVKQVD